jgi:hypothetical protein
MYFLRQPHERGCKGGDIYVVFTHDATLRPSQHLGSRYSQ